MYVSAPADLRKLSDAYWSCVGGAACQSSLEESLQKVRRTWTMISSIAASRLVGLRPGLDCFAVLSLLKPMEPKRCRSGLRNDEPLDPLDEVVLIGGGRRFRGVVTAASSPCIAADCCSK